MMCVVRELGEGGGLASWRPADALAAGSNK
jgi:hypothetical protein